MFRQVRSLASASLWVGEQRWTPQPHPTKRKPECQLLWQMVELGGHESASAIGRSWLLGERGEGLGTWAFMSGFYGPFCEMGWLEIRFLNVRHQVVGPTSFRILQPIRLLLNLVSRPRTWRNRKGWCSQFDQMSTSGRQNLWPMFGVVWCCFADKPVNDPWWSEGSSRILRGYVGARQH